MCNRDRGISSRAELQIKGGLFLDVVVTQGTTILELLTSKDQALLVWGDALLVLDLGLNIFDGVRSFDFESDGLACEGLDIDTHNTINYQIKGSCSMDVAVTKSTTILVELLASKYQALLVWGDALLVLDLGFDVPNGARNPDFERDGLASEDLDKDLHTTIQSKHQVKGRPVLDVAVPQSTTFLVELLASKDQALLVWGDALLVLDLGLDIFNGVRSFDYESEGLACEGVDIDTHNTINYQIKGSCSMDVAVTQSTTILVELLASKDQALLVWGDALLVLDLGFDILNGVRSFDFESDGLGGLDGFHKD